MRRYRILLPLILLAFFLRIWQLPALPPGLWYDEAYYTMDAAWLLDGGPWPLFFAGNNGREPVFIYLQSLFIGLLGARPFTARLTGALAGTLTIPLIYILARRLFKGRNPSGVVDHTRPVLAIEWWAGWLPFIAAAGLAGSYWHVSLSRSGFRAILLPLAAALVFYAFWRGWQEKSLKWLGVAGLALGLSQYTYLSARALPLVFALFALVWTGLNWPRTGQRSASLKMLWLGLLMVALISLAVFAPLGWLFYQNPALFSARTGDVLFIPNALNDLFQHGVTAVRLFVDGSDPGWRHSFQSRPLLGWLGWLGFWPGLWICLRWFRRASALFLVVALLVLFLPAWLAVPPVHALRLSALLPIYYLIFALGLTLGLGWALRLFRFPPANSRFILISLVTILFIETGLTVFDYFYRWARAEETYVEYNGPLVDFISQVINQTGQTPVLIPFQLYVHPTTRTLLRDAFTEQRPPEDGLSGPVRLVTLPNDFRMLNVGNIPNAPAWVWLTGQGAAYVSRPPRPTEQARLEGWLAGAEPEIYRDRFGRELAHLRTLADASLLSPLFLETAPERTIHLNWAHQAQLLGYDVLPAVVEPGQPLTLNLYWRSLTEATFDSRLFLQIVDRAGNPLNQWEGEAFREDMYRWRVDGILPSQHTLWVGPEAAPGPYLIRLGFFNEQTGQRLPLVQAAGERPQAESSAKPETLTPPFPDQVQLGLFYVSPDGPDPRLPATPLAATFADVIKLIGVTFPQAEILASTGSPKSNLELSFHWQTLQPTDAPYTVFLQLLNDRGEVISSWDSQPFNGLYPTHLWSSGEIITDTFTLPLPDTGLPPGTYRLITGFYQVDTGQRLPVDTGGDFAELAQFVLK